MRLAERRRPGGSGRGRFVRGIHTEAMRSPCRYPCGEVFVQRNIPPRVGLEAGGRRDGGATVGELAGRWGCQRARAWQRPADLEIGDTADWEVCGTFRGTLTRSEEHTSELQSR